MRPEEISRNVGRYGRGERLARMLHDGVSQCFAQFASMHECAAPFS